MNKVKKLMSWNAFPALLLFVIFLGINGVMTGGLSVSFFDPSFLLMQVQFVWQSV